MPLQSKLFTIPRDQKLEACLVSDPAHIIPGSVGDHVKKIQVALSRLSNAPLKLDGIYGPKTAAAVKAFKSAPQRRILGPGQSTPDDIVGKRTIKSLDDEMDIFENESPATSALISADVFGQPHDHSRCASPASDGEIERAPDGTMSHFATPMNPLGFLRKINIGGAKETDYLGFTDAVPDPRLDPDMNGVPIKGRLLTSSLGRHSVSDISFRSAPLDRFMRKEIPRICAPGARLTFVATSEDRPGDVNLLDYFRSIGVITQSGRLIEKSGQAPNADRFFFIVTVLFEPTI
jgi:peptidoglycan hydrolase-like protein with peptidoglycan-binding domain